MISAFVDAGVMFIVCVVVVVVGQLLRRLPLLYGLSLGLDRSL